MTPRLVLLAGVLAISCAAVFIRLADAPVLVIASLVLSVPTLYTFRGRILLFSPSDLTLPILAGALMALHFVSWIASLQLTTVASSVVLVTAHPLFVAALAPLVTGDRLTRRVLAYSALGTAGAVVIGWEILR
jgi:drug/metabolite transporter (DMT)-like permease